MSIGEFFSIIIFLAAANDYFISSCYLYTVYVIF